MSEKCVHGDRVHWPSFALGMKAGFGIGLIVLVAVLGVAR